MATQPKFNPSQQQAIDHSGPPLLITAGAGSGKTATLVGRVTRLVASGLAPNKVLMLTFTNKAAKSMIARSDKALAEAGITKAEFGPELSICAGTFHSIGYQFLHRFGLPAGFFRQQYVLGEYQTKRIWEKVYATVKPRSRSYIFKYKLGGTNELAGWHGRYATSQMELAEFIEKTPLLQMWEEIEEGIIYKTFSKYKEFKAELGGIDFDDILILADKMLTYPEIRKRIIPEFEHILVDEYQDTSKLQASFLKSIAGEGNNLVVVGDPKQSIYNFLSADVTNITKFNEQYHNAIEIQLLTNYRSNGNILKFANEILHGSVEVDNLHLLPNKDNGIKPFIHKYGSERMEARGVIRDIQEGLKNGIKPSEVAVLSRLSSTTYHLERELVEANIPYVKVGGLKLMNKLNIRQFIAFLELVIDRYNWLAWETILPMIPMIGTELTQTLISDMRTVEEWDWDAPPPVSLGSGKRWFAFKRFWTDIKQVQNLKESELRVAVDKAFGIFKKIYAVYWDHATEDEKAGKTGLEEEDAEIEFGIKNSSMEDRLEEIQAYIVEMTYHRTEFLSNFLDRFKLDDSINQIQDTEKLTISTIHSAKGLEWDLVIVMGLEDGSLPVGSRKYGELRAGTTLDEGDDDVPQVKPWARQPYLEEERRLFYVACTRAKESLHITYSSLRRGMGRKDSPFMKRLKPEGPLIGEVEGTFSTFKLEKMSSEEEQQKNYRHRED